MMLRLVFAGCMAFFCAISVYSAAPPLGKIAKPNEDWGNLYLVHIVLPAAKRHPSEYYCPMNENGEQEICLGATIVYRTGTIKKTIAAYTAEAIGRRSVRVKGLGPHAAKRVGGSEVVALLEKTDDGYWWMPMTWEIEDREFCLDDDFVERFTVKLQLDPVDSDKDESCFRLGR
jgi:hypothetical protein